MKTGVRETYTPRWTNPDVWTSSEETQYVQKRFYDGMDPSGRVESTVKVVRDKGPRQSKRSFVYSECSDRERHTNGQRMDRGNNPTTEEFSSGENASSGVRVENRIKDLHHRFPSRL